MSKDFQLEGHDGAVLSAKFDNEGKIIASGGIDKKLLLWRLPHVSNFEDNPNFGEISGHKSAITSLKWLADGKLATSSADTTVGLWDTQTGTRIRKFNDHKLVVNDVDQDDNLISSVSDDGNVFIWEEQTRNPINSFKTEYPLLSVAFHNRLVYASGIEPVIRAWDLRFPNSPVFEIETKHNDSITSLDIDDSNLISRSQDDTIRIYEPKVVPGDHIRPKIYVGSVSGDEQLLIRAIIRENLIYSGSADKTVTSWDISSGSLLKKIPGHQGTVIDVDQHEGKLLSTSVDGSIVLRYGAN